MPPIAADWEILAVHGGAATRSGRHGPPDEAAVCRGPVWFAVADGMGGHRTGVVASRLAVEPLRTADRLVELAGLPHDDETEVVVDVVGVP